MGSGSVPSWPPVLIGAAAPLRQPRDERRARGLPVACSVPDHDQNGISSTPTAGAGAASAGRILIHGTDLPWYSVRAGTSVMSCPIQRSVSVDPMISAIVEELIRLRMSALLPPRNLSTGRCSCSMPTDSTCTDSIVAVTAPLCARSLAASHFEGNASDIFNSLLLFSALLSCAESAGRWDHGGGGVARGVALRPC